MFSRHKLIALAATSATVIGIDLYAWMLSSATDLFQFDSFYPEEVEQVVEMA